jgi:hypothetical protein
LQGFFVEVHSEKSFLPRFAPFPIPRISLPIYGMILSTLCLEDERSESPAATGPIRNQLIAS